MNKGPQKHCNLPQAVAKKASFNVVKAKGEDDAIVRSECEKTIPRYGQRAGERQGSFL
jgi:hypothetical protein